jgi:hypothetical protein
MGVSFGDIAKAGQSMVLNYKDSIKSEMQLSAMLGKNVDLSEVRSKFASGDTEGALKALKAQGLDPSNMDMFQQQMLQQATGMDLTTLSKINKNTGKDVNLKNGDAKAGNETFLSAKSSAQIGLQMAQAMISAKNQLADTLINKDLEQAKQQALIDNTGNLNALTVALNQENAKKDAEIAAKTGAYGLGGGLIGAGLGVGANMLMGKAGSSLFGKATTATAEGAAEGGAGILSKVGGKALGGITAAGIEGYMEYQDNKSKGIGTGENVARTAQVAGGAGLGAWGGAAAGAALGVAAGAGLAASRCVTLLDCCPVDLPPPKRLAASACMVAKAMATTKIAVKSFFIASSPVVSIIQHLIPT